MTSDPGTPRRSPVRAALLWFVCLYRAYLSGRGPFRSVRCTFERTESCSSYGLRLLRGDLGTGRAMLAIARRIGRCGSASLFVDRGCLLWGRLYDEYSEPGELDRMLKGEGETPVTRAAVLGAQIRVQRALSTAVPEARSASSGGGQPGLLVRHARACDAHQN